MLVYLISKKRNARDNQWNLKKLNPSKCSCLYSSLMYSSATAFVLHQNICCIRQTIFSRTNHHPPPPPLPLSLRKVFLEKQWINIKQGTSEKNEPKLIQIIYKPLFPTTPCYLQSAVLQPDFSISESKARQKLIFEFSYKTGNWKVTIVHDERPRCIRRLINFKVYLKF